MPTIRAGRRPAYSPRPAILRWGACLAIATAALTGATSGVASAAPAASTEASASVLKLPPLPACVVTKVTKKPGLRTTIRVTNRCSKPISYRIIWFAPSPSDPACHLLRPGVTQSHSRPSGGIPRAVLCLRR